MTSTLKGAAGIRMHALLADAANFAVASAAKVKLFSPNVPLKKVVAQGDDIHNACRFWIMLPLLQSCCKAVAKLLHVQQKPQVAAEIVTQFHNKRDGGRRLPTVHIGASGGAFRCCCHCS